MDIIGKGPLRKMRARLESPVAYSLSLDRELQPLNPLLGKALRIDYSGAIYCVHCGKRSAKSYNQGYCYRCFRALAQCDDCIIHPEKCHYHEGSCREPYWGETHCLQDHIVYLANSSGLKVGITRATQVPTRWIDQGARQALAIVRVRSRLQSGALEVMFKGHVADKTDWRAMLAGDSPQLDLATEAGRLLELCAAELEQLRGRFGALAIMALNGIDPVTIDYPVTAYPDKAVALTLDKTPQIEGTLLGIKGQYLMLDSGVINLRRHAGYQVTVRAGEPAPDLLG